MKQKIQIGLAILLFGIIAWQYFEIRSIRSEMNKQLEKEEQKRLSQIDSIQTLQTTLEKDRTQISGENEELRQLIKDLSHEELNHSDLDTISNPELQQLFSRYYN